LGNDIATTGYEDSGILQGSNVAPTIPVAALSTNMGAVLTSPSVLPSQSTTGPGVVEPVGSELAPSSSATGSSLPELGGAGGSGGSSASPTTTATSLPTVLPMPTAPPTVSPSVEPEPAGSTPVVDAGAGAAPNQSDASGPSTDPPQPTPSAFNIEFVFAVEDEIDPIVEEAFMAARDRWQRVIIGDLPDVQVDRPVDCMGETLQGDVDDIVIFVKLGYIDGNSGILGAAGPCLLRNEERQLPLAGLMEFDTADLLDFAEAARLEEVVLHEMGHVLGVGSLWEVHGYLQDRAQGDGASDTAFDGELAIAEFEQAGGTAYEGQKVPVENMGGDGVANGHWRESALGNELMTPFLSQLSGVLSRITIAAMEDLGYEVSYAEAEDYSWPPPDEGNPFGVAQVPGSVIDLSRAQLLTPRFALDRSGELIPLQ
jgi:hypothetical protein